MSCEDISRNTDPCTQTCTNNHQYSYLKEWRQLNGEDGQAPVMWPPVPPLMPVEMRMGGSPSSGIRLKELPTGLAVGAPVTWAAYGRGGDRNVCRNITRTSQDNNHVQKQAYACKTTYFRWFKNSLLSLNVIKQIVTSEALAPEDLFEYWDAATGCVGLGFAAGPLEESVASPLGKMPSANQTLLCSRGTEPGSTHTHTHTHTHTNTVRLMNI